MPMDVSIRCTCGELRGVVRDVSARAGNRIVCYCDDCQSFAHFLGRADEILDANGGSDIFQMSPARLEITQGLEELAGVRLTASGLIRWYSACCNTAIGNTLASNRLPFVGMLHIIMDHASDGRSRDEALGPVRGRVQGRFAKGDVAGLAIHDRIPISSLFRVLPMLLLGRLRGEQKRGPFFDSATGRPRVRPRVLTDDELRNVETARDASAS